MDKNFQNKSFIDRITVPNLSLWTTVIFIAGFIFLLTDSGHEVYFNYLIFDAEKVMHGQIWRIFTTLLCPPYGISVFSTGSMLKGALLIFIYYSFASTVERVLGEREFNLYFFGSVLIGELAVMIYYFVCVKILGMIGTVYYLPTFTVFSVVMAFSIIYPDLPILLFFVIPLKAKIIGIVELVLYLYSLFNAIRYQVYNSIVLIVSALIPVLIFFLRIQKKKNGGAGVIGRIRFRMKQRQRQKEWKDQWKD